VLYRDCRHCPQKLLVPNLIPWHYSGQLVVTLPLVDPKVIFTARRYASAVYVVIVYPSVCLSVGTYVQHKSEYC